EESGSGGAAACWGRTAATKAASSASDSCRAPASRATVSLRGVWGPPRASSLITRGLSPARSARSSWVRPAARRYCRSSSPKARRVAGSPTARLLADHRVIDVDPEGGDDAVLGGQAQHVDAHAHLQIA